MRHNKYQQVATSKLTRNQKKKKYSNQNQEDEATGDSNWTHSHDSRHFFSTSGLKGEQRYLNFIYKLHAMTITLHKSDTVPNVHDENGEPNEDFVTEVRKYFEEQRSKNSKERNTRQISGCKYQ